MFLDEMLVVGLQFEYKRWGNEVTESRNRHSIRRSQSCTGASHGMYGTTTRTELEGGLERIGEDLTKYARSLGSARCVHVDP